MLEEAHHERALVPRKNVLGAVAMMDVEIDHGHALELVALQRIFGRYRHVVEEAEPHGLVAAGMVSRRAHGAKGVFEFARHHRVGGGHGRTGRAQRCLPGVSVDRRVGVHLGVRGAARVHFLAQPVCQAAQRGDVQARVRQLDVGQGRFRCFEVFERIGHSGDQ